MKRQTLITLFALFVSLAALTGCRSDVPPGGACSSNGECGKASAACYFPEGAEEGYCTRSCRLGEETETETKPCPEGLTCKRSEAEHFILGSTFCAKM